jgi:alpha-mannosidase
LAWPLNNYWDTNFSSSQPGLIKLSYGFSTFKKYSKQKMFELGREVMIPVEIHPALICPKPESGYFIQIEDNNLQLLNQKISYDKKGIIIRVIKTSSDSGPTLIRFPRNIREAFLVNTLEEIKDKLKVKENSIFIELVSNRITQILVIPDFK